MNKIVLAAFSIILINTAGQAQNSYMDNALHYNRLIREKTGDGVYKQVGTFKVVGTPYLFGERNKGDMFSTEAKAFNVHLSYNTYNQQVEFYSSANPDKALMKETGEIDSFILHSSIEKGLLSPAKFIYGKHIGSDEKAYFLELYAGPKYAVYKKYKSDLGYVSANYIQSDLRQFDMLFDYYYLDVQKKSLKKLKASSPAIAKELSKIKDISEVFTGEEFSVNQEASLQKTFEYLNE